MDTSKDIDSADVPKPAEAVEASKPIVTPSIAAIETPKIELPWMGAADMPKPSMSPTIGVIEAPAIELPKSSVESKVEAAVSARTAFFSKAGFGKVGGFVRAPRVG